MKLGIMQPYLLPYLGYFQLINAVDTFVVYDDVQYIKHGWINRNNILGVGNNPSNQSLQFTFSITRDSFDKKINERFYSSGFDAEAERFLKTLHHRYSKAPYYEDVCDVLRRILSYDNRNVSEFNANSLKMISEYVGIKTNFVFSSSLDVSSELKGEERIIALCKLLDTQEYINPIGGKELYCSEHFERNGIILHFIQMGDVKYKQYKNPFVPCLSIIDMMMFNKPEDILFMLDNYILI